MSKNEGSKKTVDLNTACFVMVILLVVGAATGYVLRMAQVRSTESVIVKAIEECKQIWTDELIISPTNRCAPRRLGNAAVVGLRKEN